MTIHKSLKEIVYDYISDKISDGSIKVNQKINEKMLISHLGVSRTPIREALIQLSSEGYIENIPRRGFVVKPLDEKRVTDIYELLGVLDSYAAKLAIDKLDESDFLKMEMYIYGMEKTIKSRAFKDYYDLQIKFHDIYIKKSGNKELIKSINSLRKYFMKKYYSIDDKESFSEIINEANEDHKYILKLFKEKKSEILEAHLRNFHWDPKYAIYEA